jgi:hypothetical protein
MLRFSQTASGSGLERKSDSDLTATPHVVRQILGQLFRRGAAIANAGEKALADAHRALGFLRGRTEFAARDDDVYVVSYPRSGTTWMQFMLYRLAGGNDLEFSHISQVSPWFERSLAIGSMTAADFGRFPSPRIMKSHLPYGWLPRPGRYVYVWRDGYDVALSYFNFYRSHLGYCDDFAAFFQLFLRGDLQYRSWFSHVAGWIAHAGDPRVLIVRYEDLHADRPAVLRRVARHLGMVVSEDRIAQTVAETSFATMKAAESKFDHATALLLERGMAPSAFLRNGRMGEGAATLNLDQRIAFERRLREAAGPPPRELHLSAFLH